MVFYKFYPNALSEINLNLDSFQEKYRRSDGENIGSVCLMVREKIGLQTEDGRTGRTDGRTRRLT